MSPRRSSNALQSRTGGEPQVSGLLDISGLRAGYGRTEVLHGIDFRIPRGSAVAVLGANGAGKTTLLRAIAGLLPVTGGQMHFDGEPINRLSAHDRARRGICLIPEGRGIFRRLTVKENLGIQAGRRKDAIDRAIAVFPKLGKRLSQVAGTLSGGEQQMVALSRALLVDPVLVLADELSVGLAPVAIDAILEAVENIRATGTSLLLVEQYVERALDLVDYVYILHKGRIVFVGEPAQCHDTAVFEKYLGETA
jgi:branched-chain amino acid transport system ATP-binding protein